MFSLERRGAEVLVHRVGAGEQRVEASEADGALMSDRPMADHSE